MGIVGSRRNVFSKKYIVDKESGGDQNEIYLSRKPGSSERSAEEREI